MQKRGRINSWLAGLNYKVNRVIYICMNTFKPCIKCQWRGKITLTILKRARRRYARHLQQFEEGRTWVKPKPLVPHIDICGDCAGTGLEASSSFPEVHTNDYPNVAIIGGGIGWMALAVACLHRGIPYTLYERDESFDARSQGYGLTLQQASKAVEWLGISRLKDGLTSTRHVVHDPSGKIIGEWGVRNFVDIEKEKETKRRNVHIPRQSLRAELRAQLYNDTGIAWWHCLKSIVHDSKSQIELEFQVGDSKQIATADIVVGADGIRSSVRSLLIGQEESPLQYLGCIVILGICPLDTLSDIESPLLDGATVFQTVNGHERIYMMPYDKNTIMWQLSFPISEEDAKSLSKSWPEALKYEWISRLWDWHSPIPDILKATDISRISGYPVYDRETLEAESFNDFWNITLLWDAMHPMSPFKGQGANQALLDALDLARDIVEKCNPDSQWREKGLRKILLYDFEKRMLERSALKVRDSAKAVKLLHSDAVLHDGDTPRGRGI